MSAISAAINQELIALALHESGHAICAAALGCRVKYTYIRYIHESLVGMTETDLRSDILRSQRIAILLGGILATRGYRHLRLHAPPIGTFARPQSEKPVSPNNRMATAIRGFDIARASTDEALLPNGDIWQVEQLLIGCQNPGAIRRKGELLAEATLSRNELILQGLAQQLLSTGDVRGVPLSNLLAEIVKVDT